MGSTRSSFEPWIETTLRPRYPELEAPLLAAIDAYDAIQEQNRVSPELLGPIVDAASSSRRPLYESATEFLAALTGQFEEAREAVSHMARDPKSHVRFNAILSVNRSSPREFALTVLRQGLCDKSATVRAKAADWAGRLRLRELVPELAAAAEAEQNAKARESIQFELKLLRDGYILTESDDHRYTLTVASRSGITTRFVDRAEVKARGIEAVVRELAKY